MPPLSGTWPGPELSNIAQVERDGAVLLQKVSQYPASIDEMNEAQLEKGFQDAKIATLEIEKLERVPEKLLDFSDKQAESPDRKDIAQESIL